MGKHFKIIGFFLICYFFGTPTYSQEKTPTTEEINSLISQDSIEKAKILVVKNIEFYKTQKRYDSLAQHIQFEGNPKLNNGDKALSIRKAKELSDYITATKDPSLIKDALIELAYIYEYAGQTETAYDVLWEALEPTSKITDPKNTDAASVHYSLGYFKVKVGDYTTAKTHFLKALELLKRTQEDDPVFYNKIYNTLGGILWQQTKLDSAQYYFQEALGALKRTDTTDLRNKLFRPSIIKLNMAILLNAIGKNSEAIQASYEGIEDLQLFIKETDDEYYLRQARRFIYNLLDNLATYHNTIGEYQRSEDLIEYSYGLKKKEYEEDDINMVISHIILGQAKSANQNYKEAAEHIDRALELYEGRNDGDSYWKSAAYFTRGSIYYHQGDLKKAKEYYELGFNGNMAYSQGEFSKDFLEEFIILSNFYVRIGEGEKAISIAKQSYEYTHNGTLRNTLQHFNHLQNLANIYYKLKNYDEALKYSSDALQFNMLSHGKINSNDSILVQYRKPEAILTNIASQYHLSTDKNLEQLKQFSSEINEAIAIVELRRKVITSHEDITELIKENENLFNFAKKLRLELYESTQDETFLDQAISLHESAIYNRIRSRLNLRENLAFKNVPEEVLERESLLKKELSPSEESSVSGISDYINATKEWNLFLESLQKEYPAYYKMRYETLEEPINDLQEKIPENTTVIRYLFINEDLYAFLVTPTEKNIIPLDKTHIKKYIDQLSDANFSVEKKSAPLYEMYTILWEPLEKHIHTKKIVIVPDQELFNLSFEMLTPKPITNFKEFSTNSLLAQYDISYNFSLLMYKDRRKVMDYAKNYVGFAPEFSKNMKMEYQMGLLDSVSLDKAYLTLLPQPFSKDLIKKYAKVFNGNYYMNENASKTLFINSAKEHKIIHIGTHAESNNLSPELSRLVFAKQLGAKETYDENSLYAYEIYNIDLSANLAILTACETGKPTFQAGEGAISLAHAFNYAGSESILTSLWNIDEVSSTQIVGYFYDYLAQGLPKDEALKKAKLEYLSTVEGRGAAPQYWAGLVLVGDTTPIHLQTSSHSLWWWIAGLLLVITITLYFTRKKKTSDS